MFMITRSDVDGYPSYHHFPQKPDLIELIQYFTDYYEIFESTSYADQLLSGGEVNTGDSSNTTFTLEKI